MLLRNTPISIDYREIVNRRRKESQKNNYCLNETREKIILNIIRIIIIIYDSYPIALHRTKCPYAVASCLCPSQKYPHLYSSFVRRIKRTQYIYLLMLNVSHLCNHSEHDRVSSYFRDFLHVQSVALPLQIYRKLFRNTSLKFRCIVASEGEQWKIKRASTALK